MHLFTRLLALAVLMTVSLAANDVTCYAGPYGNAINNYSYAVLNSDGVVEELHLIVNPKIVAGSDVIQPISTIQDFELRAYQVEACGDERVACAAGSTTGPSNVNNYCKGVLGQSDCKDRKLGGCGFLNIWNYRDCTELYMLNLANYTISDISSSSITASSVQDDVSGATINGVCDGTVCSFAINSSTFQVAVEFDNSTDSQKVLVDAPDGEEEWVCPKSFFFNSNLAEKQQLGKQTTTKTLADLVDLTTIWANLTINKSAPADKRVVLGYQVGSIANTLKKCSTYSTDPTISRVYAISSPLSMSSLTMTNSAGSQYKWSATASYGNSAWGSANAFGNDCLGNSISLTWVQSPSVSITATVGGAQINWATTPITINVTATTTDATQYGCVSVLYINQTFVVNGGSQSNTNVPKSDTNIALLSSRVCTKSGWTISEDLKITQFQVQSALLKSNDSINFNVAMGANVTYKCRFLVTGMFQQHQEVVIQNGSNILDFPVEIRIGSILSYTCPGRASAQITIRSIDKSEEDEAKANTVNKTSLNPSNSSDYEFYDINSDDLEKLGSEALAAAEILYKASEPFIWKFVDVWDGLAGGILLWRIVFRLALGFGAVLVYWWALKNTAGCGWSGGRMNYYVLLVMVTWTVFFGVIAVGTATWLTLLPYLSVLLVCLPGRWCGSGRGSRRKFKQFDEEPDLEEDSSAQDVDKKKGGSRSASIRVKSKSKSKSKAKVAPTPDY